MTLECSQNGPTRSAYAMRKTALALWVLSLFGTDLPGLAAAGEPNQCDKPKAEAVFVSGFDAYSRRLWAAAIPGLREATDLCPQPETPWNVTLQGGFGQTPYIPFFYLGRCQYELKDHLGALRQLYLSSCFGEPDRDNGWTKKPGAQLATMTDTCRQKIKSQHTPKKYPDFVDGYLAAEQEKWEESAAKMWDSMQFWSEEGGTTYSTGRWPEAYLPRFQLAKALFKIGCPQQACQEIEQSLLEQLIAKGDPRVEKERKELLALKASCVDMNKHKQADALTCQRWECWLNEKGR